MAEDQILISAQMARLNVDGSHLGVFTEGFLSHFCLFRGASKLSFFSFKSHLSASQKSWQPTNTPAKIWQPDKIWQSAKLKAQERGANFKLRRRRSIASDFKSFFVNHLIVF